MKANIANAIRDRAAWLTLAAAFDATSAEADAREYLDTIADTARQQHRVLTELDTPERDCPRCGERIVRVPVGPPPATDQAWFHLGTGQRDCTDAT
jgi:hypothetical protein